MTSKLTAQEGPQQAFLGSGADICIYGGAAGGGKTYGLLLDFVRWHDLGPVEGVVFRRNMPQILNPGGLWDTSKEIYPLIGAHKALSPRHSWTLQGGARLTFAQLEHEDSVENFQGSQIGVIYFDELCHFTKKQFFYMLSRNRSATTFFGPDGKECRLKPYVRATCNPEKNSFVRELIDPWIGDDGFPNPDMANKTMYLYHINDEFFIRENPGELREMFPEMPEDPKSLQFIPAKVDDNKILMKNDPGYLANLMSLNSIDRQKLLGGNWDVSEDSGDYFKREHFEIIDRSKLPDHRMVIRYWDKAGTSAEEVREKKRNPDQQAETASVKMGFSDQTFYIEDVTADMLSPNDVANRILDVTKDDGPRVTVGLSQDPGQAGKLELDFYKNLLSGFHIWDIRESGSKEARAKPLSAKAERGKVKLVRGPWNEKFIGQAINFPSGKKDIIDAASGALSYFVERGLVAEYKVSENTLDSYAKGLNSVRRGKYQF